jgi:hypothetical protein
MSIEHKWDYCNVCEGSMVRCGKCGNNCCNGGYGTLPDGTTCDACPSAYEMQDKGWNATAVSEPESGEQK